MCQHPGLAHALVRDRVAELHRTTAPSGGSQRRPRPRPRPRLVEATRNATGRLLVDLGLRLAAPRHPLTNPVARGPR
jgi:hypothetical protein